LNYQECIRVLLDDTERPSWVRQYDSTVFELIRIRYQRRAAAKAIRNPSSDYDRYLLGQHWQILRVAVMMLSGGQCVKCRDVADDVHHLRYKDEHGRTIWFRERLKDLEPLCRQCHAKEHNRVGDVDAIKALSFDVRKQVKECGF
jgi:5-methylcytosine-specific restriction endonuclease McrA